MSKIEYFNKRTKSLLGELYDKTGKHYTDIVSEAVQLLHDKRFTTAKRFYYLKQVKDLRTGDKFKLKRPDLVKIIEVEVGQLLTQDSGTNTVFVHNDITGIPLRLTPDLWVASWREIEV